MYRKFFKRVFDFILSLLAIIVLSPLMIILIILGTIFMKGNPFFTQKRPGKKDKNGNERIFKLIKFRTMTNARDNEGYLLQDSERLNGYGKFLRSTSLDELPELLNILIGDMAIIGPRPQLVRDMVFMSDEQRQRHNVRPGLSGLAQVKGRNSISWEDKLSWDLKYIKKITLFGDISLIFQTVFKVFKRDGITAEGEATAEDFGDYLLETGKISKKEYDEKQKKAADLLVGNISKSEL